VKPRAVLALGVLAHLLLQARPAAERVWSAPHGRDFASYHYAAQVAAEGGDPYDTPSLDAAARAERTRRSVQPYFYPPPFLLGMAWTLPLPLATAYRAMFVLNELLLAGVLLLCVRRFAMPAWAAALVLATFTPVPDNAWMGQANYLALLPALAGLALLRPTGAPREVPVGREALGGVLLGVAGMAKMTPALYLLAAALAGRWRAFAVAAATAVGLSVLALPMVGLEAQRRFYTEVLPGFAAGRYHQLGVPIGLASNHSLPNLWAQVWPGTATALSEGAARAGTLTTLALLGLWTWRALALRARARDAGADPAATVLSPELLGALGGILLLTPTFTYEHHLVTLLPALGAAAGALRVDGRLVVGRALALGLAYAMLAWPLAWVSAATGALGGLGWIARESKTMGALGVIALLLAWARPTPDDIVNPLDDHGTT
jgi:hypothetical protein